VKNLIVLWFAWVRVFSAPRPPGRHTRAHLAVQGQRPPALRAKALPALPAQPGQYRVRLPLGPEGSATIHLCFIADGEPRQQWWRRRALVLATVGIDTGPRRIHGVEVAR
jgi:hypothetical protein